MRNTVAILIILLAFSSCQATKWLDESDSIVIDHRFEGAPANLESELSSQVGPKPNRKLIGLFRTNLWFQLRMSQGKKTSFKNGLVNTFGEEPALFDSTWLDQNETRLHRYLIGKGYFSNTVTAKATSKGKKQKKTIISYLINTGSQHSIAEISYEKTADRLYSIIEASRDKSKLKVGKPYDITNLDNERRRLTTLLREKGYYYFDKNLIFVEADTSTERGKAKLFFRIKQSQLESYLLPHLYDSIIVNPNFQVGQKSSYARMHRVGSIYLTDSNYRYLKPELIARNILIKPGTLYSDANALITRQRLYGLNVFRTVNLTYRSKLSDSIGRLNLYVDLVPNKKREVVLSGEGNTNNGNSLGLSGNLIWRNRNLFRGAEFLEINLRGGLESQQTQLFEGQQNVLFNTFEYGLGASLFIPRFLFPLNYFDTRKLQKTSTRIGLNFFQQNRPDYNRSILNASFGYEWNNSRDVQFGFYPLEVNLGNTTNIDPVLQSALDSINDPFLAFSFSRHLTSSSRLEMTINKLGQKEKNFFIRTNIESAGNLLNFFNQQTSDNTLDSLFGLPYFQYLRLSADLRKYVAYTQNNYLALRLFAGFGIPLNQYLTLPIEKRYFTGGTNSLRAWQARSLGPGSFNTYQTGVDQFGEIKLEGNIEYRFRIYKNFLSAVFIDAGNIWTINDTSVSRSKANLNLSSIYKDLSIGSGFGLRYDFKYFIVRVDFGIKMYDPAFNEGNRWVIKNLFSDNYSIWRREIWGAQLDPVVVDPGPYRFLNVNLGVGLPF